MLKGLGDLTELMKKAGQLKADSERIQEELKEKVVEGSAGGGMVTVTMNGKMELLSCRLEPELLQEGDGEMLEDLIVAAVNQAVDKARSAATEQIKNLAGGLNLPGMDKLLDGLT